MTLKRLVRDLPTAPGASFRERLAALHVAESELDPSDDVDDPAGGDLPVFRACAREIEQLVDHLAPQLELDDAVDEEIA